MLAAILARIDLTRLSGSDCVEVLQARHRQLSHEQARFMSALVEVGRCGIGPDDELPRMDAPDEFSADEIRGALSWTRSAASTQLMLAWDLHSRLPQVFETLDAGLIDVPKVKVFSEWTSGLTDGQAQQICDRLLPDAPALTTGQLTERIKKMAIAVDPEWARRRYEQAVRDRKVVGYHNEDGTANVCGYNLPADRAAAACANIDALARKAKRAGDDRPIDHIRSDLYLGMLDGTYTGRSEDHIIAHMLSEVAPQSPGTTHHSGSNPPGDTCSDIAPSPRRAGVEIRVEITTLLGLDDHPGEIAGWGPVHANVARRLVRDQTAAEWRYAITNDEGRLLWEGIARVRPDSYPARADAPCRGGIVELQVPLSTLRWLAARPARLGGWARLVAPLARHADRQGGAQYGRPTRPYGPATQHDGSGVNGTPSAGGQGDLGPRSPGRRLRRHTQIRDRTCIHPGCRTPAAGTDGDHTREWARGGATVEGNIGSLCRHDHRLRHEGGWQVTQSPPGHFTVISRLGIRYHIHPAQIIEPLPDPIPRDVPPQYESRVYHEDAPIWWKPADERGAVERSPRPPPQPPETPPF
jgi:hypothetical protein